MQEATQALLIAMTNVHTNSLNLYYRIINKGLKHSFGNLVVQKQCVQSLGYVVQIKI